MFLGGAVKIVILYKGGVTSPVALQGLDRPGPCTSLRLQSKQKIENIQREGPLKVGGIISGSDFQVNMRRLRKSLCKSFEQR